MGERESVCERPVTSKMESSRKFAPSAPILGSSRLAAGFAATPVFQSLGKSNFCAARGHTAAMGVRARAFRHSPINMGAVAADEKVVVIGVAADSGCGKSTFMRRLTKMFGGDAELLDIGRETNTLVSDTTTVICLDDYHKYDRTGRSENGITALHADCQKWDLMAEQVTSLKDKTAVDKPIYNHITGELDEPERIDPTKIMIFEGLHPFYDDRVRDAMDFKIYLDISDDIKFAWKIQRDHEERGHSIESIKEAIEGRKPDFSEFVAPQRAQSDIVIEVLPSKVVDDPTGKVLRTRFIQKEGVEFFKPAFLIDEHSEFEFKPDPAKVPSSVGCKLAYYSEEYMGSACKVLELDGEFDDPESIAFIESFTKEAGTKYEGELKDQLAANRDSPGSNNGTGLFQTLCSFKLREVYEAASN